MKSDGPLILAVLLLAAGLTVIFGYGTGTAAFNAAYPISAANLNLSIATAGPAAVGGLALLAMGLAVLVWALLCAFVGLFRTERSNPDRVERWERKRLEQEQEITRGERVRLEQEEKLVHQEERLRASYPKE
jgi:signal transduction histidine kinase